MSKRQRSKSRKNRRGSTDEEPDSDDIVKKPTTTVNWNQFPDVPVIFDRIYVPANDPGLPSPALDSFTPDIGPLGGGPNPPIPPVPPPISSRTNEQSRPHLNESIQEKDLDSRELPGGIHEIFPAIQSNVKLSELLLRLQNEEKSYRMSINEQENRKATKKITSIPRNAIIEHFKKVNFADLEGQDVKQIINYLKDPVLTKSSYGVLMYNSKREILAVQNYRDKWHAPQGYRKIQEDYRFETIKETASRHFNEVIQVTNLDTNQPYDFYDIDREHGLNVSKYVEYEFDGASRIDQTERIGLFIIEIDESKLKFSLRDTNEYQRCQWFSLDDIIVQRSASNTDEYPTLRPFVEWLKDSLVFNNDASFN